jgi:hypothetical protein
MSVVLSAPTAAPGPVDGPSRDLAGLAGLAGLAERYAAHRHRWRLVPRFDPDRRWYARLSADALPDPIPARGPGSAPDPGWPAHEAWLLTWLPGQATDLHDHGGASGAFTVIEGLLTEQTPTRGPDARLTDRRYRAGATRGFGAHHVHRIVNDGRVPAVSLHVYAPALIRMTRYALDHGILRVTSVEREGRDW